MCVHACVRVQAHASVDDACAPMSISVCVCVCAHARVCVCAFVGCVCARVCV